MKATKKRFPIINTRYISPFRYPGGKNWFLPTARKWLNANTQPLSFLVEPYGGGAGVSLAAVNEGTVKKAIIAEIDPDVAATWKTILNGHSEWLTKKILRQEISRVKVIKILAKKPKNIYQTAFRCLIKNRTARGGIINKGAGLLRSGDNGKGLKSRWYPLSLAQRIKTISSIKHKIKFYQKDGAKLIEKHASNKYALFFIDPPYTKAAKRLYSHWKINHALLFERLKKVKGHFLMTYDDTPEIRKLAFKNGFKIEPIQMSTTNHKNKKELMISKSFAWSK